MPRTPQQAAAEAIFDAYEDCSTLTEAEAAFQKRGPADWTEFQGFMAPIKGQEFGSNQSAHGLVHMLRHKGVVEVERREAEKASFIWQVPAALAEGEVARG